MTASSPPAMLTTADTGVEEADEEEEEEEEEEEDEDLRRAPLSSRASPAEEGGLCGSFAACCLPADFCLACRARAKPAERGGMLAMGCRLRAAYPFLCAESTVSVLHCTWHA
jgi:hypothetical protein